VEYDKNVIIQPLSAYPQAANEAQDTAKQNRILKPNANKARYI